MTETGAAQDMTGALSGGIAGGVHSLWRRVYYEDTDAAGIVYYANYLRFAEQARTEFLRCLDISQAALRTETGAVFAVKRCTVDYRRPARLDDLLAIRTQVAAITRARLTMAQAVRHAGDGGAVADLTVEVVCLDENGRPARIPVTLTDKMAPLCRSKE